MLFVLTYCTYFFSSKIISAGQHSGNTTILSLVVGTLKYDILYWHSDNNE